MNIFAQWFLGGFTNWKTSLAAVIGAVVMFLNVFHILPVQITPEGQATILAFFLLVVGWFAKDSNITGRPQDQ